MKSSQITEKSQLAPFFRLLAWNSQHSTRQIFPEKYDYQVLIMLKNTFCLKMLGVCNWKLRAFCLKSVVPTTPSAYLSTSKVL